MRNQFDGIFRTFCAWQPMLRGCKTMGLDKAAQEYVFTPFATERDPDDHLSLTAAVVRTGHLSMTSDQVLPDEAIYTNYDELPLCRIRLTRPLTPRLGEPNDACPEPTYAS
jgi:hypothetical protein